MYYTNEYFRRTDNPTLAELMWERDLDPFNDDDCITFGKSIAKFKYNIPEEDFNDLLLEFVSEYLDERIGANSLKHWMLHLRSYGMDRRGWYEDTYDVFKDIDKFTFMAKRVERNTDGIVEKQEQGSRDFNRSEDEDGQTSTARDVSESAEALRTRNQEDNVTSARDVEDKQTRDTGQESSEEAVAVRLETGSEATDESSNVKGKQLSGGANSNVKIAGGESNKWTVLDSVTDGITAGVDVNHKLGDNTSILTTDGDSYKHGFNKDTGRNVSLNGEQGKDTISGTEVDVNVDNEIVTLDGKTTTDGHDTTNGWNTLDGYNKAVTDMRTKTKDRTTTDANNTETIKTKDDTIDHKTADNTNNQNSLKQNATGIGTATGQLGSGNFGSRVPSSGVVKDSTFEEGSVSDRIGIDERTTIDKDIDTRKGTIIDEEKKLDGDVHQTGDVTTKTDDRTDIYNRTDKFDEVTVDHDNTKENVGVGAKKNDSTNTKSNSSFKVDDLDSTKFEGSHDKIDEVKTDEIDIDETVTTVRADIRNDSVDSNTEEKETSSDAEINHGDSRDYASSTQKTKANSNTDKQNATIENNDKSAQTTTKEEYLGNTSDNMVDDRLVSEQANETRTNVTDMDEELTRKINKLIEQSENSEDLSTEENRGTMVETTAGEVVPLMELARRYYDLRVSAKDRWVKDARKLFKYNYNF